MRIWPVRDVIEPRIKVEGAGQCYPGICGRDIATVGQGRTHRLSGMGVVEVSSVNWHDAGGDFVETYLDVSGPFAEMYPYHRLQLLCVVVEPDPAPVRREPERRRPQGGPRRERPRGARHQRA